MSDRWWCWLIVSVVVTLRWLLGSLEVIVVGLPLEMMSCVVSDRVFGAMFSGLLVVYVAWLCLLLWSCAWFEVNSIGYCV